VIERLIAELDSLPRGAPLRQRIQLCRKALSLAQPQTPDLVMAKLHAQLGYCLLSFTGQKCAQNLECAIEHLESALQRYTPSEHLAKWAAAAQNLALAYAWRINGDRDENVEQAITLNARLTAHTSTEIAPQIWAHAQYQLAQLHLHRAAGDRARNLEAGIAHCMQALQVWKQETAPLQWAQVQSVLGSLYARRLQQDPVENYRTALVHLQQAVDALRSQNQVCGRDWAQAHHRMGVVLWQLGQVTGHDQDYHERAIQHLEAALEVTSRQELPEAWAQTQHRLAVAYLDRRTGDQQENVRRAIAWLTDVAQGYAQAPAKRAKVQNDLGIACLKSVRGGRSENIERAIGCLRAALKALDQDAVIWHNLAAAYDKRLRGDRIENLRKAVEHCTRALDMVDVRDLVQYALVEADLVGMLWRLGTLERMRCPAQAQKRFETAIEHGEKVVATLQSTHLAYHRAFASYNLGNAYSDRILGDPSDNQERAIHYHKQALEFFTPRNYPLRWANAHSDLGITYLERARGKRAANRQTAIKHLERALTVLTPDEHPIETLRVARNLAHTYFEMGCWQQAQQPYKRALQAADTLYRASLLRSSKVVELGQVTDLYARAAYAQARCNHLENAALTLERGRARLLADVLERDHMHLEALQESHPGLYERYSAAAGRLDELARSEFGSGTLLSLDLASGIQHARDELEEIAQQINAIDGHKHFLTTPMFAHIAQAAHSDLPLVYTAATSAGSLALIVKGDRVTPVWCSLTEPLLRERIWGATAAAQQGSYLHAYARWRSHPRDDAARAAWFSTLDDTTQWLWNTLMGDIVQALKDLNVERAILVPQGWLGLLPLHAAWTQENGTRRYAMDEVRLSYVPNARALVAAKQTAASVKPSRLLAIAEPQPVSANPLPNSVGEVMAACAHFEQHKVLCGQDATKQAVRDQLCDHAVFHFSCHGMAGFARPLEGGLVMAHDKKLALHEMLAMRLENARLAVLSACETGIPGTELPDEVISLPTGLAQAGVAGVVASLWSVSDVSTALLFSRFYDAWRREGKDLVQALCAAQQWLRDSTWDNLYHYYDRFLDPTERNWADAFQMAILELGVARETRPFAHAFHWAAFTVTGA
jgi:CHAT domain-containing protein/tetratricopeptide (TPR) repeat protein